MAGNNTGRSNHVNQSGAIESALAILATVVGAGFASGRETVVFFSRFGVYSWLGVALAATAFGLLTGGVMNLSSRFGSGSFTELASSALGRVGGSACAALYAAMTIITAGAMASGISEVAAVTLAIPYAREIGLLLGIALCVLCAARGIKALAAGGSFLIPICALLYATVAARAPYPPVISSSPAADARMAAPLAIGYACMNVTLCCGILSEIGVKADRSRRKDVTLWFAALIAALLCASNAVILPHVARVLYEPLPMIQLTRGMVGGRMLATAALLLAMATTLVAMLRSAARMLPARIPKNISLTISGALAAGCAALGFNTLIGAAYPLMGIASAAALVAILIAGRNKKHPK